MKKLLSLLLTVTMAFSLTACGSEKTENISDEPPLSTEENGASMGSLCAGAPEGSDGMRNVFYALTMSLTENEMAYDAEDPAAFWTELSYLVGLDGGYFSASEPLELSAGTMKQLAAAMFAAYDTDEDLPEMPRNDMMLRYNEIEDSYTLQPGDFGTTNFRVTDCKDEGDGVYTVLGDLYSTEDESVLSTWQFVMAENPAVETNFRYAYRVADVQLLHTYQMAEDTENQTQKPEEPITLDDAVGILGHTDTLKLDRPLEECFVSPDGSTSSVAGVECYDILVYEDVSRQNLLGAYYVQIDGNGVYTYNNVTNAYEKLA